MHRHGVHFLDATSARFALWAPNARDVSVVIGQQAFALQSDPEATGWFIGEVPCQPGDHYFYRFTNTQNESQDVPDPASRYQPEGVHGPSQAVDTGAFEWQHDTWTGRPWQEAVIHEQHVGVHGGYAGVAGQLPRLAELGITAIELMPVAQFPGKRNWGYDGVLPFAPQNSYGKPEELARLVDQAHGLGLSVMLDVVYNHFGPDGNYLHSYADDFFDEGKQTPWGASIDFKRPEVREFFIQNALMWICEYRFDGLRLDAVHAIDNPDFLKELARRVRAAAEPGRKVWLVLENEHNQAFLLEEGFDAQWNDDGHNALHVLLTGETEGYYQDYEDQPIQKLARCLGEGFVFQGQKNRHGKARGEPSGHLPPSAFVLFLQNHDQVGNRALGERLTRLCTPEALRAATTLLLLSPMIPLLFMGDEQGSRSPFLFFTDHHDELADAVREGRRAEFKGFAAFESSEDREQIPDPNDPKTFEASRPLTDTPAAEEWQALYRALLELRRKHVVPSLPGIKSEGVTVLTDKALSACWRLENGDQLRIDLNLGETPCEVDVPDAAFWLHDSSRSNTQAGQLAPASCIASLIPAGEGTV
ncbi:malto-oligosyltrehalose trehalohydrolase [Pseudomonas sp. 22-AL-CL-001]|uniref:malto-oligosyltrehalose trehalohydrolase n=1 Tax=Pseudomonas alabamensis TaxID=3064349 RepID=UPI0027122391|nr:malto-oligosyltrehalose trehalohydrolase [Pseudomonas sp. 22-AL-CL-001]MDO7911289.1 malto-oligosyltrehalose trehalohydrolase [Pseudomonas sp. 22-AL-CL-001]